MKLNDCDRARTHPAQPTTCLLVFVLFLATSGCAVLEKGKANEELSDIAFSGGTWIGSGPQPVPGIIGSKILQNAKLIDPDIALAATRYGAPQAIEMIQGTVFALFWKQPARMLVFRFSSGFTYDLEPVTELNVVPRSVRRL